MPALPALPDASGEFRYLPLAEGTARRLALSMLSGGGAEEFSVRELGCDPALVCWCLYHFDGGSPPTLGSLADWVNRHDWIRAFNSDVAPLPGCESRYDIRRCRQLARRAYKSLLRELAGDRKALDDPAALRGLLRKSDRWFTLIKGPLAAPPSIPGNLESSSDAKIQSKTIQSKTIQSKTRDRKVKLKVTEKESIAATWAAGEDWSGLVARLAKVLARADRLQRRFEQTLSHEKLIAMRELAYGASHEINNPLANISTRAQMLMRDEPDPDRKRHLAAMVHQAFRGHEMITDMMLFAKPPRVVLRWTGLGELLQRCQLELLEETVLPSKVAWRIDSACKNYDVLADAPILAVALKAILKNSLEAIEYEGTITIRAVPQRHGRTVSLRISDSGPGIPEPIRRRVFDPFYSGREAGRGLGFGLPKAWQIIQQHGGQLTLEPLPHNRTEFVAHLQAALSRG